MKEARIAVAIERNQKASAEATIECRRKRTEAKARVVNRYARDPNYWLQHGGPVHQAPFQEHAEAAPAR